MRILEENQQLAREFPRRVAVCSPQDIKEFAFYMCDKGYAVIQEVDDGLLMARGWLMARYNLITRTATVV